MSAHSSARGIHLQNIVLDERFAAEQKADCLKILALVIKNLAHPVKAQDDKYKQLKLDNAKVRDKLLIISSAVEYLKAIGFVEESQDGISILRVKNPDIAVMKASLQEVSNALDMVAPINNTTTTTKKSIKKPRMEQVEEEKKSDDPPLEKLSEKQKARRLLEEKEKKEKEIARLHRKKTAAQIKQDKWVRANDPNWKSGVSAAMAKSGSGIETFRDRHGEH
mmetsp:Transcript_540/g.989  ORF Transcript_540/g.989 Transcript_540/m.989 type:complete len:222 (+) Transcript_540:58-723(+)